MVEQTDQRNAGTTSQSRNLWNAYLYKL